MVRNRWKLKNKKVMSNISFETWFESFQGEEWSRYDTFLWQILNVTKPHTEFFLISLSIPLIIETDCKSDFPYNFKHESPSIPSMAAKLDRTAATTSLSQDFFHNVYKKTLHQNVFNK